MKLTATATGRESIGTSAERDVQQEEEDDGGDHHRLLHERAAERVDRARDEVGPVVGELDADALREGGGELREPGLDRADDVERVLAVAHHDDPADRLALAVPLEEAAPDVRAEPDLADVAHEDRGARRARGADRDPLDVAEVLHVAAAAHVVLAPAHLDHAPADVVVRVADRGDHVLEGDADRREPRRVHRHLVLLLVPADAGHLRDAGDAPERVAQGEVLERAQLVEPVLPGGVDERVLQGPADARRVGAEPGLHALREPLLDGPERLRDAAARPVDVRPLLEDDVDERHPEHREAAHVRHARRRHERRDERVGDLVLDERRAPAHPLGVHDDLRVREIRDRVELHRPDGPRRPEQGREHRHEDDGPVARAELDDPRDHPALSGTGGRPPGSAAPRRRAPTARRPPRRTPRRRPSAGSRSRGGSSRS